MKTKDRVIIKQILCILLTFVLFLSNVNFKTTASEIVDPVVIVSLGDSYSSGEGVEPFYGQDKPRKSKMWDEDWLAHRSEKSWPSQLVVPGIGTTKDYRVTDIADGTQPIEWYFAASSGAVADEIYYYNQRKFTRTYAGWGCYDILHTNVPRQLDIFENINSTVDYVTLTIGGNDVGFADIIQTCVIHSTFLGGKKLENKLNELWDDMDSTRERIKKAYTSISETAGSQANIIVAGYPKLLDKNGKGAAISKKEATLVNENVTLFNEEIADIVNECYSAGLNIHFVDVEAEFDKDGGHQAYSEEPWINEVMLGAEEQDLDCLAISSAYSIHPNELGTQAYARCVNAKIAEIENSKKTGTLSGKICSATDRNSPVEDAEITIYKHERKYSTAKANAQGNYSISLPVGEYKFVIEAKGYVDFRAYATVTEDYNNYMETFLLVEGEEGELGTAKGAITSALTGIGVEGVSLSVRKGWNNTEHGGIITNTTTDKNGKYTLSLELGNYTLVAEKEGYVSTFINVIVQKDISIAQNGTITPNVSGDNFRVVLTWGLSPRDLDSHVSGTLSNGDNFYVSFSHKSQIEGEMEICNLDVDDTTSYGPETITLNAINESEPYYYYIHRFSSSGTLVSSEAQIKLYQGEKLVAIFNVPTDQGDGRYWNVFAIKNGQLIINNTLSSSANTSYAN